MSLFGSKWQQSTLRNPKSEEKAARFERGKIRDPQCLVGSVVRSRKNSIADNRQQPCWALVNKPGGVAETSGSALSLPECADAGQRVDILVFVRGSARRSGPRGAKVGEAAEECQAHRATPTLGQQFIHQGEWKARIGTLLPVLTDFISFLSEQTSSFKRRNIF